MTEETKQRIEEATVMPLRRFTGVREAPKCSCSKTILCVDDNPFNLVPLTMLLKNKLQLECETANNGAQAVEKFTENRNKSIDCNCGKGIKIIFMDINMPIMDGYQAT